MDAFAFGDAAGFSAFSAFFTGVAFSSDANYTVRGVFVN